MAILVSALALGAGLSYARGEPNTEEACCAAFLSAGLGDEARGVEGLPAAGTSVEAYVGGGPKTEDRCCSFVLVGIWGGGGFCGLVGSGYCFAGNTELRFSSPFEVGALPSRGVATVYSGFGGGFGGITRSGRAVSLAGAEDEGRRRTGKKIQGQQD